MNRLVLAKWHALRYPGAVVAFAVVCMLATTAALAASAVKDPESLLLRKSDAPKGASYDTEGGDASGLEARLSQAGLSVDLAAYLVTTLSKTKGYLELNGVVLTTGSAAQAKKGFPLAKKSRDQFWKTYGDDPGKPVTLPKFGDQQFARYLAAGNEGIGIIEVVVRKNSVLWVLQVKVERRPSIPTRAELVGIARKYGLLQKARVGSG